MYILGYTGFTRDSRTAPGFRNPFGKTGQDFNSIFEFREGEVPFSFFPLGYFGHDGSAALIKDGRVIACAAEERFTRLKFSLNLAGNTLLPKNAINYCLSRAGIGIRDVSRVAHYCRFTDESVKERGELLRPFCKEGQYSDLAESFRSVYNVMMREDVIKEQFEALTGSGAKEFIRVDHHLAHAASCFYPSGYRDALIMTIDGTGEVESALIGLGEGTEISELHKVRLPVSLGTLYLIMTVYLGFKTLGDEYKVMGLASYGDPSVFRGVFDKIVALKENGEYDCSRIPEPGFREFVIRSLGAARKPDDKIEQRHADAAAALQDSLNRAAVHTLSYWQKKTGQKNLVMAGGVALNCTMNGVIARSGLFKKIFIQPASSDEGCSAGAALYSWYSQGSGSGKVYRWNHVYLGPEFKDAEIIAVLRKYEKEIRLSVPDNLCRSAAKEIAGGKVIGWFQGRMEFGPRALGSRSILADPRIAEMKDIINEKVKRREAFRPFAPSVLAEHADEYFDMTGLKDSPYMLFTVPVKRSMRNVIPAVTHVDGTSRIQTVSKRSNYLYHRLISEFYSLTGVPLVLNTSFNVKNEPIVCTPEDAVKCFLSAGIDSLFIGKFYVTRRD